MMSGTIKWITGADPRSICRETWRFLVGLPVGLWKTVFKEIETDKLRARYQAPSCVSKGSILISGLREQIVNYVDYFQRRSTLGWWMCCMIEDIMQDFGMDPWKSPAIVLPWSTLVVELKGNPLDPKWMSELVWDKLLGKPSVCKNGSVRWLEPFPSKRLEVSSKEYYDDPGEFGSIVHRRFIDYLFTEVRLLIYKL